MKPKRSIPGWLLLGDFLAALVITLIGFLFHEHEIRGWRWLSTFIPALAGWFAVAPWLGVYDRQKAGSIRQVWRPALAAALSAPLVATLRGFWLNSAILPLFVLVLAATEAFGFLVWRSLWTLIAGKIDLNG